MDYLIIYKLAGEVLNARIVDIGQVVATIGFADITHDKEIRVYRVLPGKDPEKMTVSVDKKIRRVDLYDRFGNHQGGGTWMSHEGRDDDDLHDDERAVPSPCEV